MKLFELKIFNGTFIDSMNNALEKFESGCVKPKRAMFYANPYFKMYDRFSIVDMRGEML